MPNLIEILSDLNVTIADTETFLAEHENREISNDLKRSIGQLKAARASLIVARRVAEQIGLNSGSN